MEKTKGSDTRIYWTPFYVHASEKMVFSQRVRAGWEDTQNVAIPFQRADSDVLGRKGALNGALKGYLILLQSSPPLQDSMSQSGE